MNLNISIRAAKAAPLLQKRISAVLLFCSVAGFFPRISHATPNCGYHVEITEVAPLTEIPYAKGNSATIILQARLYDGTHEIPSHQELCHASTSWNWSLTGVTDYNLTTNQINTISDDDYGQPTNHSDWNGYATVGSWHSSDPNAEQAAVTLPTPLHSEHGHLWMAGVQAQMTQNPTPCNPDGCASVPGNYTASYRDPIAGDGGGGGGGGGGVIA